MLVYNYLLLFLIGTFIYSKTKKSLIKKEVNRYTYYFTFIILWLISGLRYMVGTDFNAYSKYFYEMNIYTFNNSLYEKGYYLINKGVSLITNNSQFIFLVTSFITIYFINKTLKEYSDSYSLSVFLFVTLYLYFNSFNLVRQYLVVSILFYSLKYIIEKNFKKFLLAIFLASMFHMTAILMIPFYWLLRKEYSTKEYSIMFIVSISLVFLTPKLISIIGIFFPKYLLYMNYNIEGASANSIILITLITFIFAIINKKKILKFDKNSLIFINATFFALVFSIISINNIIIYRICIYFYIFILLLVPLCIKCVDKTLRISLYLILIGVLFLYNIYMIINNNAGIYPYKFNVDFIIEFKKILLVISIFTILMSVVLSRLKHIRFKI